MMTYLINQLISYKGVCRTAPATPGLVNKLSFDFVILRMLKLNQLLSFTQFQYNGEGVLLVGGQPFVRNLISRTFHSTLGNRQ